MKNKGNLIIVAFFCAALLLFFLAGVKGSWLNTFGTEGAEEREEETAGGLQLPEGMESEDLYIYDLMMKEGLHTLEQDGFLYRMTWTQEGGYRMEKEPIPGYPVHEGPGEPETDEALLADPDRLARMIEEEDFEGCRVRGRRYEDCGGLAVLRTERVYYAMNFGLKRCSCGRLIAVPAAEIMRGIGRRVNPTSTPLHVHRFYRGEVRTEQRNLLCEAEDNENNHGVDIRFPDGEEDFCVVCDGNRCRLYYTREEEAEVMRYLRLWMTAEAGKEEP